MPGLLVIDPQPCLAITRGQRRVLGRIGRAVESGAYQFTLATRFTGRGGRWDGVPIGQATWCAGAERNALEPRVRANASHVWDKAGYAVDASEVAAWLRSRGYSCDVLCVCGIDVGGGVLASCFALWDAGIRPMVVPALCASPGGWRARRAGLECLRRSLRAVPGV